MTALHDVLPVKYQVRAFAVIHGLLSRCNETGNNYLTVICKKRFSVIHCSWSIDSFYQKRAQS